MEAECVFCAIAMRRAPAAIVFEDEWTMAFVDLRQFNAGHTLVIPRRHYHDVRELDMPAGAALMRTVSLITRVVAEAFPNQGISLWSSIGAAAFQEVPHLHIHVHPRLTDDGVLRVYPHEPENSEPELLEQYAARLRARLDHAGGLA